jgi:hypothetical protein
MRLLRLRGGLVFAHLDELLDRLSLPSPPGKIAVLSALPIRRTIPADAEVIAWHRARMFQDMGMVPDDLFEAFRAKSAEWVRPSLASGETLAGSFRTLRTQTRLSRGRA